MSASRTPLDLAMAERSLHVRKRWVDIAREAGITTSALSGIRRGEYRPSAHTARALEDALGWEHGSIEAILNGGEPTVKAVRVTEAAEPDEGQAPETGNEPTLSEVRRRLSELTAEVKELQRRDAERERQIADEIERLRGQQPG